MKVKELKEGCLVLVTDNGYTYSTYQSFLRKRNPHYKQFYVLGDAPSNGALCKVLFFDKHDSFNDYVVAIQRLGGKQVYLINIHGIEKYAWEGSETVIIDYLDLLAI